MTCVLSALDTNIRLASNATEKKTHGTLSTLRKPGSRGVSGSEPCVFFLRANSLNAGEKNEQRATCCAGTKRTQPRILWLVGVASTPPVDGCEGLLSDRLKTAKPADLRVKRAATHQAVGRSALVDPKAFA